LVAADDEWFDVHESALGQFAKTSDARSEQLQEYIKEAAQLAVSPDAFGHIPFIGPRIYQAYKNHVTETTDGLSAAAQVMEFTSLALLAAVTEYQHAEDHILHLEHLAHEHAEHERHLEHELNLGYRGTAGPAASGPPA
jgi:hypothetical protein